jgi:seryl-tRNA synthetase
MLSELKRDVENALEKIKWFATLLSERINVEIMVFRLLYKSEKLKKRREDLFRQIGEEIYKMKDRDKIVHINKNIIDALKELDNIEPQIKENVEKASEISKIAV